MRNLEHILISLAPRHAKNIFDGIKHIELRRRPMNVEPGTIAWIYVTLPVGSLVGMVKIAAVHKSSPSALWRRFGSVSGLAKSEFFAYLDGLETGVVLVLKDAKILHKPLSLQDLRGIAEGFNPPQFFIRVGEQHPLFNALTTSKLVLPKGVKP